MKRTLTFEEGLSRIDWEQLEREHRIVIEGNIASVWRRRLFGDKPLFTATAILGTKAWDITRMNCLPGRPLELDHEETFTESNVASELEPLCMIILAEWDIAQQVVNAE
jgi:hypothetical protein